jgi:hypothetical protein
VAKELKYLKLPPKPSHINGSHKSGKSSDVMRRGKKIVSGAGRMRGDGGNEFGPVLIPDMLYPMSCHIIARGALFINIEETTSKTN